MQRFTKIKRSPALPEDDLIAIALERGKTVHECTKNLMMLWRQDITCHTTHSPARWYGHISGGELPGYAMKERVMKKRVLQVLSGLFSDST